MTKPAHLREAPPLDTTARLLTLITAQLGAQLGTVRLNGTRRDRRPADGPPPCPEPSAAAPAGTRDS
ncbi:hypothetical protein [Streptomyces sp. CAU 1734]|uniref:hypothetical protein n=1 Tax=Streptomyces sp. CAU 1734 TaxID=3140360 RepID=UPI003261C812